MARHLEFRRIVDREPNNPNHSFNGGDYRFGRTVVINAGVPVAMRYWTSAEFPYNQYAGIFTEDETECTQPSSSALGWENGEILEDVERLTKEFKDGRFAMIKDNDEIGW